MKNVLFKYIIIVIFFLSFSYISSQELTKDQLIQLPFDSIEKIGLDSSYDTSYRIKVLNAHIAKAKSLNDTSELIKAYRRRAWDLEFEEAIKSIDSGIQIIADKSEEYSEFVTLASYTKGAIFYINNHPEKAIDEFIKSFHNAEEGDFEHKIDCINLIASLKREYGQQEEAIVLQRESLQLLKKHKSNIENYDLTYLTTLDNISRCFIDLREIDSCRFYIDKGISLALKIKDYETFESLRVLNAQANYYDGNFIKSRDTLLNYLNKFEGTSMADMFFYLGMIEGKLGDSRKKQEWFSKLDNVLANDDFPLIDNVKEVYKFLLKDAIAIGNDSLENNYLNRLLYYDSITLKTRNHIASTTLRDFDLPIQKKAKSNLENQIKQKSKWLKFLYALVVFLIITSIFILINNLRMKRRFNHVMNTDILIEDNKPKLKKNNSLGIDEEIVRELLEKINNWEKELGYLDTSLNQNFLAKELNTNSSYLSKVINAYKGMSFSRYLKDLRITYAINYLKTQPEILSKKSTVQISEMFGFNSIDVFVKTFKEKTGISPSSFFRQLKKG